MREIAVLGPGGLVYLVREPNAATALSRVERECGADRSELRFVSVERLDDDHD